MVKTSASNAEGAGLMPGQGGKIPPCSVAKKKKTQKQYCNKFNEDFKKGSSLKKNSLKKKKHIPFSRTGLASSKLPGETRRLIRGAPFDEYSPL